jgi:hypothetical protein
MSYFLVVGDVSPTLPVRESGSFRRLTAALLGIDAKRSMPYLKSLPSLDPGVVEQCSLSLLNRTGFARTLYVFDECNAPGAVEEIASKIDHRTPSSASKLSGSHVRLRSEK